VKKFAISYDIFTGKIISRISVLSKR